MTKEGAAPNLNIWLLAFGYFSCYVPYSSMAKAISGGMWPGMGEGVAGSVLLPVSVTTSLIMMLTFITIMGWWRFAGQREILGKMRAWPSRWTFLSGCCTAAIIVTTTMAYTFTGVSIVFVMLLMRGGVLILGPIVDSITGRKVRWFSLMGMLLSLGALVVAFAERGGYAISIICAIDILAYLGAYFVRLRLMSRLAKSQDSAANIGFWVEEQMVATPVVVLVLIVLGVINVGGLMNSIHYGWTGFLRESGVFWPTVLIGIFSQGTGIFGGLILLDKNENTFCIPVNRSSSILAGVVATYALAQFLGGSPPSSHKLVGAGLIIAAILFLSLPPLFARNRGVEGA